MTSFTEGSELGAELDGHVLKVLCANPDCRFDYLHPLEPITHYEGDEYGYDNPFNTRGVWIEIRCWCENCDKITQVITAFHKGQLFTGTNLYDGPETRADIENKDIDRASAPPTKIKKEYFDIK